MPFRFDLEAKPQIKTGKFFSLPLVKYPASLIEDIKAMDAETDPVIKLSKLIDVLKRYLKEKNVDLKFHFLFKKFKRVDQAKIEGANYLLTQLNELRQVLNTHPVEPDHIEKIKEKIYRKFNENQNDIMWQGKEEARRLVCLYLTAIHDIVSKLKDEVSTYSCSGATT